MKIVFCRKYMTEVCQSGNNLNIYVHAPFCIYFPFKMDSVMKCFFFESLREVCPVPFASVPIGCQAYLGSFNIMICTCLQIFSSCACAPMGYLAYSLYMHFLQIFTASKWISKERNVLCGIASIPGQGSSDSRWDLTCHFAIVNWHLSSVICLTLDQLSSIFSLLCFLQASTHADCWVHLGRRILLTIVNGIFVSSLVL